MSTHFCTTPFRKRLLTGILIVTGSIGSFFAAVFLFGLGIGAGGTGAVFVSIVFGRDWVPAYVIGATTLSVMLFSFSFKKILIPRSPKNAKND